MVVLGGGGLEGVLLDQREIDFPVQDRAPALRVNTHRFRSLRVHTPRSTSGTLSPAIQSRVSRKTLRGLLDLFASGTHTKASRREACASSEYLCKGHDTDSLHSDIEHWLIQYQQDSSQCRASSACRALAAAALYRDEPYWHCIRDEPYWL